MSQIPGFDREFLVQDDLIGYLSNGLAKRGQIDFHKVTYLSSDNLSYDVVRVLKEKKNLFSITDEEFVIDHNASGIALACKLKNVPFIILKVAENRMDQENNLDTYSLVLSRYIDLGKAVISTISDIGRSDVLEGDDK